MHKTTGREVIFLLFGRWNSRNSVTYFTLIVEDPRMKALERDNLSFLVLEQESISLLFLNIVKLLVIKIGVLFS